MVKNRKDLTPRRSLRGGLNKAKPTANLNVVVRVRPNNPKELQDNFRTVVKPISEQELVFDPEEDNTPFFFHGVQQRGRDLLKKAHKNMRFTFDRVFSDESNNEEVFNFSTKGLITKLMDGCNCSVFVYGATGAGKTYTMLGSSLAPGITFLTMQELFQRKELLADEREFEMGVSFIEVYNENVQDLLKPGVPLHLREDARLGVMVAGITFKKIDNPDELFGLLSEGNKRRTQHPTDANAESSRSHAIFQVYISMTVKATGQKKFAKLSMIDLAGSERGAATGCKGIRFTEGANINRSLLALGNCINNLADGKSHIPYRDSKLTRILKDSLGGNCQTVMIANVSPSSLSFEDTYNTLKYATRAKKIKSNVKGNVTTGNLNASQYLKIIEDLNKEIQRLKEINKNSTPPICEKCAKQPTIEIKENIPPTPKINLVREDKNDNIVLDENIKILCEDLKVLEVRRQRLLCNKKLLDIRVSLKDQANNRLSDFCPNTPDKEAGHKKFEETICRLKKQANGMCLDVNSLQGEIQNIKDRLKEYAHKNPEHNITIEMENLKTEVMKSQIELAEYHHIFKLQSKEMEVRGDLMQTMAIVLKDWFYLLRGHKLSTESMDRQFHSLRDRLQGACSVSFEECLPSSDELPPSQPPNTLVKPVTIVNSIHPITIPTPIKEEEAKPLKRKFNDGMNQTFTMSSPRAGPSRCNPLANKILKVAPPKQTTGVVKPAVNKKIVKKIGTMGVAARFQSTTSRR